MMRRGPLDRYSPEWVLRQAQAHEVEGSIEFHTTHPATFFLDGGKIYAAAEGVDLAESGFDDESLDEEACRTQVVQLLAQVMGEQGGWYFHDPLGQHPGRGAWVWETATLLMDTRAKAHEVTTLATFADRTVALDELSASSITLSADAWSLVVQLAGSMSSTELRTRLGWQPDRLLAVLNEIEARGVLTPEPTWQSPLAFSRPGQPAATADGTGHHTGPLAPPPALPAERSSKRRKLPGRRTASS